MAPEAEVLDVSGFPGLNQGLEIVENAVEGWVIRPDYFGRIDDADFRLNSDPREAIECAGAFECSRDIKFRSGVLREGHDGESIENCFEIEKPIVAISGVRPANRARELVPREGDVSIDGHVGIPVAIEMISDCGVGIEKVLQECASNCRAANFPGILLLGFDIKVKGIELFGGLCCKIVVEVDEPV